MNFKFKKGDEVCITYGSAFGSAAAYMTAMIEGSTITACKETPEGNVYRLKHFVGWWAEENLVFKSQPAKNSPSRDEAVGADTLQGPETKYDTGDSGESEFDVLPLEEAKWYRIHFSAKLTPDDLRAMKKCFFDAMNESMEIYDLANLEIEEV